MGYLPVVTASSGSLTYTVNTFVRNTIVAKLNNVVPLDPVQYSCQKNFVILSTDGYWNGNAGYDLNGNTVGNQDGTAPRPYYDGAVVSQTTSQVSMTQTQMAKTVTQLQKRDSTSSDAHRHANENHVFADPESTVQTLVEAHHPGTKSD